MMHKRDLVRAVWKRSGVPLYDVKPVCDALFDIITEELRAGRAVHIRDFFKFEAVHHRGQWKYNPKTTLKIWIDGYLKPVAKAGIALKRKMRKYGSTEWVE